MEDFIINLLNLKQEDLQSLTIKQEGITVYAYISLKRKLHKCPRCMHMTDQIKDYTNKQYNHGVMNNFNTIIVYKSRRYVCPFCGKTFIENSPFGKTYNSVTNTTVINILEDLKHYTSTFSHTAQKYNVSTSTVINIFDNHVQIKRHKLQSIICIDEFYFNRHSKYKYAFMIMGFNNKLILDIVESRRKDKLYDYFFNIDINERKTVKYICMDMYQPYKDIIPIFFPETILCIDSFHVIKNITDSLNALRKRMLRRYNENKQSKEYRLLKHRYKLLLRNNESINNEHYFFDRIVGYTTTEAGVLEELLSISSQLKKAYKLKEAYRDFNFCKEKEFNYNNYRKELETLIIEFISSDIKEMKKAGETLKNWKSEILNSFTWFDNRRISNGCIEGKNNYIKKIINNGNGLQNFKRSRNRFMYSQNQYEKYTISVGSQTIKSPGKIRGSYNKK